MENTWVSLPFSWTKAPNFHVYLWRLTPVCSIMVNTGEKVTRERTGRCPATCAEGQQLWERWTLPAWYLPFLTSAHRGPPGSREMERIWCLRAHWQGGSTAGRQESSSQPCHPLLPSARLHRDAPFPGVGHREVASQSGVVFWLACLVGFARSGAALEEIQILCTPS